jgi:hypothetical protein
MKKYQAEERKAREKTTRETGCSPHQNPQWSLEVSHAEWSARGLALTIDGRASESNDDRSGDPSDAHQLRRMPLFR